MPEDEPAYRRVVCGVWVVWFFGDMYRCPPRGAQYAPLWRLPAKGNSPSVALNYDMSAVYDYFRAVEGIKMEIDIGIKKADRAKIAAGLSKLLADTCTKTHNFHCNVTGPMFNILRLMLEGQAVRGVAAGS